MGRLEVQFQSFFQICEGLFFGVALAGDIDFQALGDIPLPFAPDGCGERSLHVRIVAQAVERY